MSEAGRYTGERSDGARTKAEILGAAQRLFSARGYGQVSVRDIARVAQSDPSLVVRYFGSKEALFSAALVAAVEAETQRIQSRINEGSGDFGSTLVAYFDTDELPQGSGFVMAIMASGDEAARAISVRVFNEQLMELMKLRLGNPDADERAALITLLISGFATYRSLLPLAAFSSSGSDRARRWVAETIQRLFHVPGREARVDPDE